MRPRHFLLISLLVLALSACSKSASPPLPTITPPAGSDTGTATPLVLPPTPAPSLTPAGSPTPFISFEVNPAVAGLKLRVGPGYLFDALRLLDLDTALTVEGKSPGGDWIKVKTAAGTQGWVFAELVKSDVDLQAIPVVEPQGIVVIKGRVVDVLGTPIQGVGFELKPQGAEASESTVAYSDVSGEFFAFLPADSSGAWTVTQTTVACKSNVWADEGCSTYKPGYIGTVEPNEQSVTLPQVGMLEFSWK
jgi:hypothetical protein